MWYNTDMNNTNDTNDITIAQQQAGIPVYVSGIPPGWENAPLSALAALAVAGDDADLFDQIKAELQGE